MGPNRTLLLAVMASLALGPPGVLAAPPPQERADEPATAHAEPRWLKGNLHTHSLWSDGNDYPEMNGADAGFKRLASNAFGRPSAAPASEDMPWDAA
jgi:hypothetical protein